MALRSLAFIASVLLGFLLAAAGAPEPLQKQQGIGGGRGGSDAGVRRFGAVGDGEADDTRAIQQAVDEGDGDVKFPPGVYRITRPIVIDLDSTGFTSLSGRGTSTIVMAGEGPAFRFVGTHGGTAAPDSVKENVWERQRMPLVEGLEIVGRHEQADGIEAAGTMQLTLARVIIRRVRHAVHLVERNRNVLISECHFYENRGVGIYLDGVNLHQTNITGSHISYNRGGGIVVRGGDVRNIHIAGCDIEGNMAPDAPATANVLLDCRGGSVAEVAISGCTIQHSHEAPDSANIRMLGADPEATTETLSGYRYGHLTITGNVLSDAQLNIDLQDVRSAAIAGNTLWKGYAYNLRVIDSSNVVFGANMLDRNPRYRSSPESSNGVLFRGCKDCTISGLHVVGVENAAAGLILEDCRRMNVTGCTLLDCDGAGVLMKNVSHSRLTNCLIRDDRDGAGSPISISSIGGEGNQVADNLVSGRVDLDGKSQIDNAKQD